MGCLSELVGSSLACVASDGSISIGSVGLSNKEITDYMSGDYASASAFLADRIAMAEKWVTTDMLTKLAPRMIGKTFVDRGRLGDFDDSQTLQTAYANTIGGIVMDVCVPNSNVKILVSQVGIWSDVGGAVTVTFTDLTDGTVLATQVVTTTSDRITSLQTDIQLSIRRKRTRILVSTDLPTYYKATMGKGGCSTCKGTSFKQGPFEAYGARISDSAAMSYDNLVRSQYTSGLSIIATLDCDHDAFVCEHAGLLATAMGYKVAEMCVDYGVGNMDRMNSHVNSGRKEELEKKRDRFGRQYADIIGRLWDNMPIPTDPVCWVCNSKIRVAVSMP